MKSLLMGITILLSTFTLNAQGTDTGFKKFITAFSWMPDGQTLILNIMKIDKAEKLPPSATKFFFHINTRTLKQIPIEGSNLTAAPNGKFIAYFKRIDNKPLLYLYDLEKNTEIVLVDDTLGKFSLTWSGDGKNLAYNINKGRGPSSQTEIVVYDLTSGEKKQITNSGPHKSYSPSWNPSNDQITYYLEKGDGRDQIFLTDKNGSFHTNLTKDTSTLNYYPTWIDQSTIMYTEDPDKQMILHLNGNRKEAIAGIKTAEAKYNGKAGKIAYIENEVRLVLYDMKSKTNQVVFELK